MIYRAAVMGQACNYAFNLSRFTMGHEELWCLDKSVPSALLCPHLQFGKLFLKLYPKREPFSSTGDLINRPLMVS
jgi:hypothetical protein